MRSVKSDTPISKRKLSLYLAKQSLIDAVNNSNGNNTNRLSSSLSTASTNIMFKRNKLTKEDISVGCKKCFKALTHSINIIKAVLMRLVFSLHSFIAIYIMYTINHELWCLVNIVGVVFLLIELFITIIKRKGKEPKW